MSGSLALIAVSLGSVFDGYIIKPISSVGLPIRLGGCQIKRTMGNISMSKCIDQWIRASNGGGRVPDWLNEKRTQCPWCDRWAEDCFHHALPYAVLKGKRKLLTFPNEMQDVQDALTSKHNFRKARQNWRRLDSLKFLLQITSVWLHPLAFCHPPRFTQSSCNSPITLCQKGRAPRPGNSSRAVVSLMPHPRHVKPT